MGCQHIISVALIIWKCLILLDVADPVTVTWLAANMDPVFGFPDIVRFSWQTASRLLDERAVKVAW